MAFHPAEKKMRIVSIAYQEYVGQENEWILEEFSLCQTNLIVGKNSAGKSRLLNLIHGLARLITGVNRTLFASGTYDIVLEGAGNSFRYQLELEQQKVVREKLEAGDRVLFSRQSDGTGTIWAEKISTHLEFSVPQDVLVVGTKRDKVQHPFLEPIHIWAEELRHYAFGTSLGRELISPMAELMQLSESEEKIDASKIAQVYTKGFFDFGEDFDRAILSDLEKLGYKCTDVGMEALDATMIKGIPVAVLYVKEADLAGKTTQMTMSQGMFRALGLVIHLTYASFVRSGRTVLIDDVGEGLDFERSSAFVELLIEKSERLDIQLIMTTNDRFVMNNVKLEYWGVISRAGQKVRVITNRNSPETFEDFSFYGLNNFDFFASGLFEKTNK